MADSVDSAPAPKIHSAPPTVLVKDRRSILALIAGSLAASTAAVAGVAAAKGEEAKPGDDYSHERWASLLKLFGKMEAERRLFWLNVDEETYKPGVKHCLCMEMTDEEHLELLVAVCAGLVVGGFRTQEQVEAMFPNRGAGAAS